MPTTLRHPGAQQQRDRLQGRRLPLAGWRHRRPAQPRADRPTPRLSDRQLGQVEQALLEGATANGFVGELWTLDRITSVIQRLTGVRHHPAHVWALLHHRLGWSVQRPKRPKRRSAERDQAAIDRWVAQDWPRIKQNADRRSACVVFFDESALSLTPNVRRTWAPRGQPPTLTS